MTEQERTDFIELKKIQINKFPESTIEYFRKVLKPVFFIPRTVQDIENISNINLQFCQTKEEKNDYLTIIRMQSVFDGLNIGCGRNIPIIVKTNDKYLGVIRITSTGRVTTPVNELIKWTERIKWHGKTGGVQRLGYAQAMVPCQPFGFNCLGGKLLAMLSTSKEITDYWYNKYNSSLHVMMTLAMTGGITQYTGLKNYKYIGTSNRNNRGIYFANLYDNSVSLLNETEISPVNDRRLTIPQILHDWKPRAIKRFRHLEKENKVKTEIDTYDSLYQSIENPFFT